MSYHYYKSDPYSFNIAFTLVTGIGMAWLPENYNKCS